MSRIAAFGGTFDPVHAGHLRSATYAADALALDTVVFVPSGHPPHKLDEPLSPFCHRFAMLALALQDDDRFLVADLEVDIDGPTYTVETLRRLRAACPGDRIFFLLGSDSFVQITTWHRWQELPDLATLVVLHRPTVWGGELLAAIPEAIRDRVRWHRASQPEREEEGEIVILDHEPVAVSATGLRRRFNAGEIAPEGIDPRVARYAVKHRLYDGQGNDGR